MPIFRKGNARPVPNQPSPQPQPPKRLAVDTPSPFINVLGRELNKVLPQQSITGICAQLANNTPVTASHERLRGFVALDWLIRTWTTRWSLFIPEAGEQMASALADSPPIRDIQTAETAGAFVMALSGAPENAERFVADNYKPDNFYDTAAVKAARQASATVATSSAGVAVADAATSVILDECLAARTDVALQGAAALALLHSLDSVWPYIQTWANGPGEFDAKKISISSLAPVAAQRSLEPTVEALQHEVCGLYVELHRLG